MNETIFRLTVSEKLTVAKCREMNQSKQYGERMWNLLLDILKFNSDLSQYQAAKQDPCQIPRVDEHFDVEKQEKGLKHAESLFWKAIEALSKTGNDQFPPGPVGPVGEYPVRWICIAF